MDYYTGSSTLQDMIECDIRSNFSESVPSDHGDILGSQDSPGLASPLGSPHHNPHILDNYSPASPAHSDISKFTWVPTISISQLNSPLAQLSPTGENADPNLLVDPQTGVPITRPVVTLQSTVTTSTTTSQTATQTLNQVNTTLNQVNTPVSTISSTGLLQTAQGHFVISPASFQHAYIQQPSSPVHVASPAMSPLRQHLQSISQPASPVRVTTTPAYILTNGTIQTIHSPSHKTHKVKQPSESPSKTYPKPVYSYSCLIAMALKNSETGCLPVSEIYSFMCDNFPYFKTAPDGWKNCVRHNLSLNKCFEKIEPPDINNKNSVRHNLSLNKCFEKMETARTNNSTKKGCLWAMNPAKIEKMEEEIAKWRKKDMCAIKRSMAKPEVLDLLEKGQGGCRSPHHSGSSSLITPGSPAHHGSSGSTPTTPKLAAAAAPATPTTLNNNPPKILLQAVPIHSAVAAALASNTGQVGQVQPAASAASTTTNSLVAAASPSIVTSAPSSSAGFSSSDDNDDVEVIEVTPARKKLDIKLEKPGFLSGSGLSNLTSDDLTILDGHLGLDTSLTDMDLQSGLFDELTGDDDLLGLDSLPANFFSGSLTASPITVQAAATPIKEEKFGISSLHTNYIYNQGGGAASSPTPPFHSASSPTPTFQISRPVSAHT